MKKFALLLTLLSLTLSVSAQSQMRIWQGGESEKVNLKDAPVMIYGDGGSTINIAGTTYEIANIDSITMIPQVFITFNDATATVSDIPASVRNDITVEVDGAYVTITNTNVSNEVEFVLSGSSANGSFTYNGSYKATLRLNGVSLLSNRGAALDIQCGKRIALILEDGTYNSFEDYAQGEQKGCIYCKGHMEVEGAGSLLVKGNLTHAIKTKEYLQLKKSTGTITILSSVGDAIHVGQYFLQNGGKVNINTGNLSDGIQVETLTLDDDVTPDPDKENNGQIFIKGGYTGVVITSEDCKAIKCDGLITISGGHLYLKAEGRGSRGIQTGGDVIIGQADGATTTINIEASGNRCGNEEHSDDPHRCMGMKIDKNLTINGGTITVTNTGTKSRGIKLDGTFTFNTGTLNANVTTATGTVKYNETR